MEKIRRISVIGIILFLLIATLKIISTIVFKILLSLLGFITIIFLLWLKDTKGIVPRYYPIFTIFGMNRAF